MDGIYGGLITIITYGKTVPEVEQESYLITQNDEDILTSTDETILVQT